MPQTTRYPIMSAQRADLRGTRGGNAVFVSISQGPVPTLIFVLCVSRHLSFFTSTVAVAFAVFVSFLCVFFRCCSCCCFCCCCCCYPLKCTFNCRQFDVYMQPEPEVLYLSFIYLCISVYECMMYVCVLCVLCVCVCLVRLPVLSCFLREVKLPTGTWRETKRFGCGLRAELETCCLLSCVASAAIARTHTQALTQTALRVVAM